MKTTRQTKFERMATEWHTLFTASPRLRLLDSGAMFDGLKEQLYLGVSPKLVESTLDARFGVEWRSELDNLRRVHKIQSTFGPLLAAAARSRKFKHEAA